MITADKLKRVCEQLRDELTDTAMRPNSGLALICPMALDVIASTPALQVELAKRLSS